MKKIIMTIAALTFSFNTASAAISFLPHEAEELRNEAIEKCEALAKEDLQRDDIFAKRDAAHFGKSWIIATSGIYEKGFWGDTPIGLCRITYKMSPQGNISHKEPRAQYWAR